MELVIIIGLATLFGSIWLLAHWNLSRQPPHHKDPEALGMKILYQYQQPKKLSKLVCISGCSKGLGRAMAREFCVDEVAGGARNQKKLDELSEEISTDHHSIHSA